MKTALPPAALLALVLNVPAQVATPPLSMTIVDAGPNQQTWHTTSATIDSAGNSVIRTNRFVELRTGMNVWSSTANQWVSASDVIELVNGSAVARKAQHQAIFAPNITAQGGTIDLLTPDQKRLECQVVGVAFTATDTGKSVFVGNTKSSVGQLVGQNQVTYPDAFDAISADVLYTMRLDGLEQDIILRKQLPSPTKFGLNPDSTRVEVWTEFFNPPNPRIDARQVLRASGLAETNEFLDFGAMQMGPGNAYSLPDPQGGPPVPLAEVLPISKSWAVIQGQTFLIESVPYADLVPYLAALPAAAEAQWRDATKAMARQRKGMTRHLPVSLATSRLKKAKTSRTASIRRAEPAAARGVVLDFTILSSQSNLTLQGDTTYYVSGTVNLSGTTVIEGGTVVKYTNAASGQLNLSGVVQCQTSAYRPAIFTSKDDNTVGDTISGSTGSPSGYYGNGMLYLTQMGSTLNYLYFRYAQQGIYYYYWGGNGSVLSHSQFVNCNQGLYANNSVFFLRNALMYQTVNALYGASYTGVGENITFDQCGQVAYASATSSLALTNCLMVQITNASSFTYTAYDCQTNSSSANVFQTVGAGSHYLAANSTYRDAGTKTINPYLLADLQQKTTYPPIDLGGSTLSVNTALSPQAQRDGDTPDLGYHYEPIDYTVDALAVTNATLTLTNGVVLAMYGNNGVWLQDNSKLVSQGSPLALNHLTRYFNVQEVPMNWGSATLGSTIFLTPYNYGNGPSSATLLFTSFDGISSCGYHIYAHTSSWLLNSLTMRDCQTYSGTQHLFGPSTSTYALNNNLFDRVASSFEYYATVSLYNNLFRRGLCTVYRATTNNWIFQDNLFDNCSLTDASSPATQNNHNGYINTTSLSGSTGSDKTPTAADYLTGPLGARYYPTSGGNLSSLIAAGSRTASSAGLYQETSTLNEAKETGNTVTIGFHYVAESLPAARATYVGSDTTTSGNWKGVYGGDGYVTIDDYADLPAYATVQDSGDANWEWSTSSSDTRNLQDANSSGRTAACWYSSTSFAITVNQNDGKVHRLALYFLDWDTTSRSETITITDPTTGSTLDSRSVSSFHNGTYLVWEIVGNVVITITNTGSPNAVVSGLFLDTKTTDGCATFVALDATTSGNWQGTYGADGYNVINDSYSYPAYATVTPSGNSLYTWATSTTDTRALQRASTSGRIAACWWSNSNFTITLGFSDGKVHRLALYTLNWDNTTRNETFAVTDTATGTSLDSRSFSPLVDGKWLLWDVTGNITITVTCNAGSATAAVVSGLFFSTPNVAGGGLWDANGDGIPDYLSDANGNGSVDSGEIAWNTGPDLGLAVQITEPKTNAVIP
ncbi:MAG: hypothetical protein KGS61_09985 [Verrucomicrobia bacterium]|nr:hypothetical protein [Verrucomicrobiota bacterium]